MKPTSYSGGHEKAIEDLSRRLGAFYVLCDRRMLAFFCGRDTHRFIDLRPYINPDSDAHGDSDTHGVADD